MKRSTAKSIRRIASVLLFAAFACASEHAFAQADASTDYELRSVILLVRHGVRAPIESEIRASSYNAQPWPSWPVAYKTTEKPLETSKILPLEIAHPKLPVWLNFCASARQSLGKSTFVVSTILSISTCGPEPQIRESVQMVFFAL
jgi:hypothetical protein